MLAVVNSRTDPAVSTRQAGWRRGRRRHRSIGRGRHGFAALALLSLSLAFSVRAALQFDVFVGYGSGGGNDGIVREGSWFPVACEIFNDGQGFDAVFEFSSRQIGAGQSRRMKIELPANTRKRFVFPVFAGASRYASWDARLLDARGRLQAERLDLRSQDLSWESVLLGGVARSFAGLPTLPPPKTNRGPQTRVARMTSEQFPDNPFALEGLRALYLNSEKAIELKVPQAAALLAWVHGGGELILGIEQAQDVTSTKWLRELLPVELTGATTNRSGGELQSWLASGVDLRAPEAEWGPGPSPHPSRPGQPPPMRSRGPGAPAGTNPYALLRADAAFEEGGFFTFTGALRDGTVVVSAGGQPLAVSAPRGRGQVTVLLFSPEREPFKSWKHRAWFWARLLRIPGDFFEASNPIPYGGWSLDAVFGAMIETRQVRKLPVEWLLALLVLYLIVIGPLDHWWLKKINRQMLTWLTFPAYVALFSLLIYYIGYKLRAGETEWNELHLVDVLPRSERVELRGRTFASLYSSVNAKYKLASDQPFATLRGEYRGAVGGGREGRLEAELVANSFRAEVAVPVWDSLLYVSDWEQPAAPPLAAKLSPQGGQYVLTLENRLGRKLGPSYLAFQGRLYRLAELGPNQHLTITLQPGSGADLALLVRATIPRFQTASSVRQQAFGRDQQARLELTPENVLAATFITQAGVSPGNQRGFVYPEGLELSPLLARGDAVLLAWDAGHSPVANRLLRVNPPRQAQNTMFRLGVPVTGAGPRRM